MDIKKDIRDISKKPEIEAFIGDNMNSVFLFKKTEKVVGVLYLFTKFLPESDPLFGEIKRQGLSLLSLVSETTSNNSSWTFEARQKLKVLILNLISMLGVARLAGFLSEMNYSVIVPELTSLLDVANKEQSFGLSVSREVFNVESGTQVQQLKDQKLIIQKTGVFNKGHSSKMSFKNKTKDSSPDTEEVQFKRQDRRGLILDVFNKSKGLLSVKDIAFSIKDCSEKTLQRELLALVDLGILKKEGERRWSKYILA